MIENFILPKKQKKNLEIIMRDILSITPYEKNAKLHPKKQIDLIKNSIKEFGWGQPIAIDKDGVIIVGHGRFIAAQEMEMKEVPVVILDLPPDKVKAYRLADNKTNESDWNMDFLFPELKELDFGGMDIGSFGFDSDLILEPKAKDDDVPEIPLEPKAKDGEIYQLGKHRIMCGDSMKKEDVDKLMNEEKAQMCFTDPPYNVDYGSTKNPIFGKQRIIENDKMSTDEYKNFCKKFIDNINLYTNGLIYVCHAQGQDGRNLAQLLDNNLHWSATIIWVKNRMVPGRAYFQRQYEPIWFGWNKGNGINEDRTITDVWEDLRKVKTEYKDGYTTISFQGFKVRIEGEIKKGEVIKKKQRTDIWRHDKPNRSVEHPTMKPVALVEQAIISSSRRNDIVLDLFLGSGSTLIASEKTGRICYGMELDPKYIDVIIERWEKYTGDKAILLNKKQS